MSNTTVSPIIPTSFDSYVSESGEVITLAVHVAANPGERTGAGLRLTPSQAVELIAELALALEFVPATAYLASEIAATLEVAEEAA